jgi:hypothetical protein
VCNRHVRDVANRNSGSVVDATHESDGRSLTNSSATKKDHARYAYGRQRLAFRNKLQGRVDLPINGNRSHPLTERVDSTGIRHTLLATHRKQMLQRTTTFPLLRLANMSSHLRPPLTMLPGYIAHQHHLSASPKRSQKALVRGPYSRHRPRHSQVVL